MILKELFDTCIIQGIIQETETTVGVSTKKGLYYGKLGAYRILAGLVEWRLAPAIPGSGLGFTSSGDQ